MVDNRSSLFYDSLMTLIARPSQLAALICPLCGAAETAFFYLDDRREYFRCHSCELVFVPASYFLSLPAERAHYDRHENDSGDPRYRKFLSRLVEPMLEYLRPGDCGLDFGSGPGPTLSVMFTEAGWAMDIYDPAYQPVETVWRKEYDFITASEVVEHLHQPLAEFQRLWLVLRPGGVLGVMTKRVQNLRAFENWHYKNDPTHVVFYSDATFHWLSDHLGARLQIVGPDVVLLHKA